MTARRQRPQPIPARFLRPRVIDGSYPFRHLTCAQWTAADVPADEPRREWAR